MKVSSDIVNRNSVDRLTEKVRMYADAGTGLLYVKTPEIMRGLNVVRNCILSDGHEYQEWDVLNGIRNFTIQTINDPVSGERQATPFPEAFCGLYKTLFAPAEGKSVPVQQGSDNYIYHVFVSPKPWLEMPHVIFAINGLIAQLPTTNHRVILLGTEGMPEVIEDTVTQIRLESPGIPELSELLSGITSGIVDDNGDMELSFTKEELEQLAQSGAGMTQDTFEQASSMAIVAASHTGEEITPTSVSKYIMEAKTDIVNQNDLLELYKSEDIKDVGGLDNLKDWVEKRKHCYTDEAQEFGIEAPKGLVFVGVPGSGKSLTAKAISGVLGIPCVRLDFGKVFNSLVGQSEAQIRKALQMIESMSPCVCLVDEIDKGLGGSSGGSGDSGVSSRVLGTFLTWLQDCQYPVFTVVTANNVTGLPPELLRKGRFDATFATGLPTVKERLDVLKIHLRKRGHATEGYAKKDLAEFIKVSNGFVPAEIEAGVKEALVLAFDRAMDEGTTPELGMQDVTDSLKSMIPLSVSHKEDMDSMLSWSAKNATPASLPEKVKTNISKTKPDMKVTRIRKKKSTEK